MFKKMFLIGFIFFIGPSAYAQGSNVDAQDVEIPFDVNDVIEKISHCPIEQDGKIVIQDIAYEAFFDERGIVLMPRETNGNASDLVIPVTGSPEIKNGKVVYQTESGLIIFEGTSKGLRFRETSRAKHYYSPINNHSGNVARLVNTTHNAAQSREGEFLIDTNLVYTPHAWSAGPPEVTSDGTNYLVVWYDNRTSTSTKIYGARVSPSGTVLDPAGIVISSAPLGKYLPSATFDGTNYIVVWHSNRYSNYPDIFGARMTPSGTVLDPEGILISTADGDQMFPTLISNGITCLVVWNDERNGASDIYGARIDQSGVVLDPNGIAISTAANRQASPSVSYDGTNFFVAWADRRSGTYYNIYGSRVSTSGSVLDPAGIPISTAAYDQSSNSIAFDGTNYFVVWQDKRGGTYFDIYGSRVTTAGTVLDPSGITISTAADDQAYPSIVFDGTNYFAAWSDKRDGTYYDIYGTRINTSGTVLDPSGIAISTASNQQQAPSVGFNGTNYFVVWWDWRGFTYEVYGARVTPSGTVLDPSGTAISTIAYTQYHPSVAFDGTNYLVVWTDSRDRFSTSDYHIYGARVSQTGTILDPAGIAISTESVSMGSGPEVAFGNSDYFVVWTDDRDGQLVYGARINTSGTVLDPSGILLSTTPGFFMFGASIAFDGTNFMVAWTEFASSTAYDIYGSRVNQSGIVLDSSGIIICEVANYQLFPAIAFDGTNYLVVWQDDRNMTSFDIYGARVSTSGTVLDPSGIAVSTAAYRQQTPAVAFGSVDYFTVWEDWRGGSSSDIYGSRIDTSGTVLDPAGIPISTDAVDWEETPVVAATNSSDFFVVWQNWQRGELPPYDIYGVLVNQSGSVLDSFAVSLQSGDQISPAAINSQGESLFIVYSGWVDSINGQPANTMRIWGKLMQTIGVEEHYAGISPIWSPSIKATPNPFRNTTKIKTQTTNKNIKTQNVELHIYDAAGKLIRDLRCDMFNQKSDVLWDGTDESKSKVPAGIYFVHLVIGEHRVAEKIVFLR